MHHLSYQPYLENNTHLKVIHDCKYVISAIMSHPKRSKECILSGRHQKLFSAELALEQDMCLILKLHGDASLYERLHCIVNDSILHCCLLANVCCV